MITLPHIEQNKAIWVNIALLNLHSIARYTVLQTFERFNEFGQCRWVLQINNNFWYARKIIFLELIINIMVSKTFYCALTYLHLKVMLSVINIPELSFVTLHIEVFAHNSVLELQNKKKVITNYVEWRHPFRSFPFFICLSKIFHSWNSIENTYNFLRIPLLFVEKNVKKD